MDGATLFAGSAGTGGWLGDGGSDVPGDGALFGVSVASVVKWSQRKRQTGSCGGQADGRRNRPWILRGEREWLLARIAVKPDLTLRAVLAELAARGMRVSCRALWNFLRARG